MTKKEMTTAATPHTPGPFTYDGKRIFAQGYSVGKTYGKRAEEYAKFIVLACNAHDELLAACKRAAEVLENYVHGEADEMCAYAETLEDCIEAITSADETWLSRDEKGRS